MRASLLTNNFNVKVSQCCTWSVDEETCKLARLYFNQTISSGSHFARITHKELERTSCGNKTKLWLHLQLIGYINYELLVSNLTQLNCPVLTWKCSSLVQILLFVAGSSDPHFLWVQSEFSMSNCTFLGNISNCFLWDIQLQPSEMSSCRALRCPVTVHWKKVCSCILKVM